MSNKIPETRGCQKCCVGQYKCSHMLLLFLRFVEMPAELYDQNTAQFLGFAHKIIHCFYYKCSQK